MIYACFTEQDNCITHYVSKYVNIVNQQIVSLNKFICKKYIFTQVLCTWRLLLCKNVNFVWRKIGGWGCGWWNGPLRYMYFNSSLYLINIYLFVLFVYSSNPIHLPCAVCRPLVQAIPAPVVPGQDHLHNNTHHIHKVQHKVVSKV